MRVLVTGGAGFIGSNFVRMALSGNLGDISEVVVLDKLTYAGNIEHLSFAMDNPKFSFIEGDICDSKIVLESMAGVDAVLNFAAESHVDRSIKDSSAFIKSNILGVQVLLDACVNLKVKRFLQVSTDEVYGSIEFGSWTESEPLLPNSPYAASKAAADLIVRSYVNTHNLDAVITRCSNNYGPQQYPEKLIPRFVFALLSGEKVPIYGDGLNSRDWLHVEDHCQGISIVLMKGLKGEIYNIGGGRELTNLEITKIILTSLNLPKSRIEYVTDRLGHDRRYSVNWKKVEGLGYSPKMAFDTEILRTIDWYRNRFQTYI